MRSGLRCCVAIPTYDWIGVARVSGIRAKTAGRPAVQRRARRGDGFAPTAAGVSGTHGIGGRCLGVGGCDYRRRAEPLVSSGRGVVRGAVPGRSGRNMAEHSRLSRRPAFVAGMLLALDRSAVLRRNILE